MTDNPSDDPQHETGRLKAELADKEREIEELKREATRTKAVGDALWSHDIYLRSRKKLAADHPMDYRSAATVLHRRGGRDDR